MGGQAVDVLVARARVNGATMISLPPLAVIEASVRQPVRLRFLYHVQEHSNHREHWSFDIHSTIGDQHPSPAAIELDDRWGLKDDVWGLLEQSYVFDRPGDYEGTFDVHAMSRETGWLSHDERQRSEKVASGTVRIHVVGPR